MGESHGREHNGNGGVKRGVMRGKKKGGKKNRKQPQIRGASEKKTQLELLSNHDQKKKKTLCEGSVGKERIKGTRKNVMKLITKRKGDEQSRTFPRG